MSTTMTLTHLKTTLEVAQSLADNHPESNAGRVAAALLHVVEGAAIYAHLQRTFGRITLDKLEDIGQQVPEAASLHASLKAVYDTIDDAGMRDYQEFCAFVAMRAQRASMAQAGVDPDDVAAVMEHSLAVLKQIKVSSAEERPAP